MSRCTIEFSEAWSTSTASCRVQKSIPIVARVLETYSSLTKRSIRQDLPTPLSPTMISLIMSSVSSTETRPAPARDTAADDRRGASFCTMRMVAACTSAPTMSASSAKLPRLTFIICARASRRRCEQAGAVAGRWGRAAARQCGRGGQVSGRDTLASISIASERIGSSCGRKAMTASSTSAGSSSDSQSASAAAQLASMLDPTLDILRPAMTDIAYYALTADCRGRSCKKSSCAKV